MATTIPRRDKGLTERSGLYLFETRDIISAFYEGGDGMVTIGTILIIVGLVIVVTGLSQ